MTQFAPLQNDILMLIRRPVEELEAAVRAGVPFRGRIHGKTLLHIVAAEGRLDSVRFLVAQGLRPNARDEDGRTPLNSAVQSGNRELVDYLLTFHPPIRTYTRTNWNLLFDAAYSGDEALFDFFLQKKLDPRQRTTRNENLLVFAAMGGHTPMFRRLLALGLNIRIVDTEWQETVLHMVCRGGNPEIIRICIEEGLDPNARDYMGSTPLFKLEMRADTLPTVRFLVEHGADTNVWNHRNDPLLKSAIRSDGSLEILRYLAEQGAKPWENSNSEQEPLLFEAVRRGTLEMIHWFAIDLKMDVNTCYEETTPLSWAVEFRRRDVIDWLLEHGARFDRAPEKIRSVAVREGAEMLKFLESRGLNITYEGRGPYLLGEAVWSNDLELCRFLISRGADVNDPSPDWGTPLRLAHTLQASPEIIELLIQSGARE